MLYIIFGLIFLLLAVLVFIRRRILGTGPDYRVFFILGVCWFPVGISTHNRVFLILGLVFLLVGLINRGKWGREKKWMELSPAEKKWKISLKVILAVILLAGVIFMFIFK